MKKPGTLFLLPNLLSEKADLKRTFLPACEEIFLQLDGLIAENEREGRRFLSYFPTKKPAREIPIAVLDVHSQSKDALFYLDSILAGETWGLISDQGLPCIADPGYFLVAKAKERGIKVETLAGPSSIIMGLMLSGLPAQRFFFQGYLDKEPEKRKKELVLLEKESSKRDVTQVIIETPYRNMAFFTHCLEVLNDETSLCLASDLMGKEEMVLTKKIKSWKKGTIPDLAKRSTLFIIHAS